MVSTNHIYNGEYSILLCLLTLDTNSAELLPNVTEDKNSLLLTCPSFGGKMLNSQHFSYYSL